MRAGHLGRILEHLQRAVPAPAEPVPAAHRTALQGRRAAARRRAHESRALPRTQSSPLHGSDFHAVLDRELAKLPPKYRAALVVCDLEGHTRVEAARLLGCAEGTVASRL